MSTYCSSVMCIRINISSRVLLLEMINNNNRRSAGQGSRVTTIFGNEMSDGYHLKIMGQGPIMGLGHDSPSMCPALIVGLVT